MWPIMWGVTTSFKLEDLWTLECARAALVEMVKIMRDCRALRPGRRSSFCPYLWPRWEFLKNSFIGGSKGPMAIRKTIFLAFWAPGVVFMSQFWSKSAFFSRFGPVDGPPGVCASVRI